MKLIAFSVHGILTLIIMLQTSELFKNAPGENTLVDPILGPVLRFIQ